MKKLVTLALALGIILGSAASAEARVFVSAGFYDYPGYYPAYPYPYPAYYPGYYPTYYAAPPVVYAAPQPVTTIVTPTATVTASPTPSLAANQTSATYTDGLGRTCRQFQTTAGVGPAAGTACLMPNGTWQTVP